MDQLGDIFEENWSSLCEMYTNTDESEFITQLLGEFSPEFLNFWPAQTSSNVASIIDEDSLVFSSYPSSSNVCLSSQEISNGDVVTNGGFYDSMDFSFCEEEDVSITEQVCTDLMMLEDEGSTLFNNSSSFETEVAENISNLVIFRGVKKRSLNTEAQKNKRNVKQRKSKKAMELTKMDESKSDFGALLTQTSSSNCLKTDSDAVSGTEEFSNLTTEDESPSLTNGKGKSRAKRGSATDPQSLYARKRREKINDRLRILQGLVPNGTKVDISTMLDEAVQYVKFLQFQIKLLSCEDMWMYAPLAYNGMDLGLGIDLKM